MSSKRFRWANQEFREEIEHGVRSVVLTLGNPPEEFSALSGTLLREEAAAAILKTEQVQERLKRK